MRVEPPTRTASFILPASNPASLSALRHGFFDLSIKSSTMDSNLARESFMFKCFGPLASAVTKGRFISVSLVVESSILAFSAASLSLCSAMLSFDRSTP